MQFSSLTQSELKPNNFHFISKCKYMRQFSGLSFEPFHAQINLHFASCESFAKISCDFIAKLNAYKNSFKEKEKKRMLKLSFSVDHRLKVMRKKAKLSAICSKLERHFYWICKNISDILASIHHAISFILCIFMFCSRAQCTLYCTAYTFQLCHKRKQ